MSRIRPLSEAGPTWGDDNELSNQRFPARLHKLNDSGRKQCSRVEWPTNQEYAYRGSLVGVDKLTKVFVFGQQQPLFLPGQFQHGFVVGPGCDLRHGHHFVASVPQRADHSEVAAFVREKRHASALGWLRFDHFLVGQNTSRVGQSRMNVFLS